MLKVMAFLVKRPDVERSELIDYYESHHVPLILSLAPAPLIYRRNYVVHDGSAAHHDDFDIITELGFADSADYESWVAIMYSPGFGVAEDEAKFLERSRTRSYVVEEYASSDVRR